MKNTLLILIILFSTIFVFAQTNRDKAIDLYKQNKTDEAIVSLEKELVQNPKDDVVWNYLGLAYLKKENYKESQKSFEKATKLNPKDSTYFSNLAFVYMVSGKTGKAENLVNKTLRVNPNNVRAYFVKGRLNLWKGKTDKATQDADTAIKMDLKYSDAYFLKSEADIQKFGSVVFKGAKPSESLEYLKNSQTYLAKCLEICEGDLSHIKERLEMATAFVDYFNERKDENFESLTDDDPTVTPLKILSKPKPSYTNIARVNGVTGTIRLAILFAANGKKFIILIKPLKDGLNESAIRAAREIRFEPKKVNGNPVSVVKMVEFSFTIY
jgi:TonB family protein